MTGSKEVMTREMVYFGGWKGPTLVISVVRDSISLSSNDRSAKPGRTCLAWSLSRVETTGVHREKLLVVCVSSLGRA